jgi:hypothetical protein
MAERGQRAAHHLDRCAQTTSALAVRRGGYLPVDSPVDSAMSYIEVAVQDVDGTHARVPVGTDDEHIPDTDLVLLSADPSGRLFLRHYELQLCPLHGMWLYIESGDDDWDHQPISASDNARIRQTPESLRQLLRAPNWR